MAGTLDPCPGIRLEHPLRMRRRAILCMLVSVYALSCNSARAQGVAGTIGVFVSEYIRAFNAKDVSRLRSLEHPASIACVTSDAQYFYDEMLKVHIRDPIPPAPRVETKPVAGTQELPGKGWAEFPIRPSHEIHLTYSRGPEESADLTVWAVRQGDRWYQVEPCLTTAALEALRADEPDRRARIADAQARVASIEEPLRSELKALIREGKPITARKRYQAATGTDLDAAMLVIYHLTAEALR